MGMHLGSSINYTPQNLFILCNYNLQLLAVNIYLWHHLFYQVRLIKKFKLVWGVEFHNKSTQVTGRDYR